MSFNFYIVCFDFLQVDPGFDFCERLDTSKDHWEEIAPLPTPRFALSATTLEGKILAMGGVAFRPEGFNNFTTIESYDPKTGAATLERAWTGKLAYTFTEAWSCQPDEVALEGEEEGHHRQGDEDRACGEVGPIGAVLAHVPDEELHRGV